jgi:Ubiquitin/SUMO-activating enzyme ubiquitin-like domain
VRDLSTLTLKDFVAQVVDSHLNLKPGYVIEFNENILYDSTPDQDDEDDMEMFQRILKKTLTNLKIKDLSKLLIQGAF